MPAPFADAIARLHAAMSKVANGDISAITALYTRSDDATSFYGWGGYEKGWDAVAKRWEWAGKQFKGGTVAYRNITTVVTAELAYSTDIETFKVSVDGIDEPTQWSNRVTHIFRLEEGEWRLVHRHANRLEERYEPSSRLKRARSP
jgi:ketosteroid isomerase-like protein